MNKWSKTAFAGLGIAALVVGLSACGQHTPEEQQARFVKKIVHKLDLNETQTPYAEKLVAEMAEFRQEMKQLRTQQLPKLQTLVSSDSISSEQLHTLFEAPKQVIENHQQDIITQIVALHSVLNAEQKQELAEKLEHIQQRFEDY